MAWMPRPSIRAPALPSVRLLTEIHSLSRLIGACYKPAR